jgi:hypothetical protein
MCVQLVFLFEFNLLYFFYFYKIPKYKALKHILGCVGLPCFTLRTVGEWVSLYFSASVFIHVLSLLNVYG